MITIISSTNRIGAYTRIVSEVYGEILKDKNEEFQLLDLKDLPHDFIFSASFENRGTHNEFNSIQKLINESDKFVFIIPEYNGSFPGVLKAFIDGLSFPGSFAKKAAGLVGLSSGSMGGALAISHLTDILNYLGMHVMPVKPRLSGIGNAIKDGKLTNMLYLELLNMQAAELISFNC